MITSAPVTLPCPRIGMATNLVKAFISAASVSRAALFMCLPRVIDRPMPKKKQPNLHDFMRWIRSSSVSRVRPVSAICSSPTCWPLTIARRIVISSKSLPGRTCRKMSAALALFVSRISTSTIVRSLRPRGRNLLFCMMVYFVKWRGWHSAGFPPQYTMKSALCFTSPNVQVTLPPNWAAISVGPCQSDVWLSSSPPS